MIPEGEARLTWNTDRLRKGMQRDFHVASQEHAGTSLVVTERAARELAPLIEPTNIEKSLEHLYRWAREPEKISINLDRYGIRDTKMYMRINIWWGEEWVRPDSPYEVRTLSDDERERSVRILDHLSRHDVFAVSPENIGSVADAVIICETATLERRFVVTGNMQEAIDLQRWTRQAQQDGIIHQDQLVVHADEALRSWYADRPGEACEAVARAFWPDTHAEPGEVEARLEEMEMELWKAKLGQVGHTARQERRKVNNWSAWVERVRTTLPHRARAADRRHPANPDNRDRDWSRPTPDWTDVCQRSRWRIRVGKETVTVDRLRHDGKYETAHRSPNTATQAVVAFLVEHDIEVKGMPKHGGKSRPADGFSTAMDATVQKQLAKMRGPEGLLAQPVCAPRNAPPRRGGLRLRAGLGGSSS